MGDYSRLIYIVLRSKSKPLILKFGLEVLNLAQGLRTDQNTSRRAAAVADLLGHSLLLVFEAVEGGDKSYACSLYTMLMKKVPLIHKEIFKDLEHWFSQLRPLLVLDVGTTAWVERSWNTIVPHIRSEQDIILFSTIANNMKVEQGKSSFRALCMPGVPAAAGELISKLASERYSLDESTLPK